jgi:hypothetical protein
MPNIAIPKNKIGAAANECVSFGRMYNKPNENIKHPIPDINISNTTGL